MTLKIKCGNYRDTMHKFWDTLSFYQSITDDVNTSMQIDTPQEAI